jgi:hypothetical protein
MKRNLLTTAALVAALTVPTAAQRGPAPAATHLSADVLALACAPREAVEVPDRSLHVTGGQNSFAHQTYAPGDLITINAGTDNGMEVGREYYVRRLQGTFDNQAGYGGGMASQNAPSVVNTVGWIKVYAVDNEWSLATITHACDVITVGDYREPFVLPVVPKVSTEKIKPERDHYARIMFGTDQRRSFAKGDFFIINFGTEQGVTAGMRFVVYRDKKMAQNFLYDLGEAVAVDVRPQTATLQVLVSRDAFAAGDYVAMRKAPQQ